MAATVGPHVGHSRTRPVHDAKQVDLHNSLDQLVGLCRCISGTEYTGVVDPNSRLEFGDQCATGSRIGHVKSSLSSLDVDANNLVALTFESRNQRSAKPSGSPGDDRYWPLTW